MSVSRIVLTAGMILALAPHAWAQRSNFVPEDEPESEEESEKTKYEGRITSSTLGYRETGEVADPLAPGTAAPESASPINRLFTDMRLQVNALHVSGGKWDVRLDSRARQNNKGPETSLVDDDPEETVPTQSGTFGNTTELEVRELYAKRRGQKTDWFVGRQFVLDIAATKIDGLRFVHRKSADWNYIGFAGLYPVRGSRSVLDDYPRGAPDPNAADPMAPGARIMPVAAGGGAAYRTDSAHGAIGAGVIFPLSEERSQDPLVQGQLEKPRVFVTSNGYWRRSPKLDVYHYIVVDVESAREGVGFNNVSIGANWHPSWNFRVSAAVSHVDTETLNVTAQTRLEEPDPTGAADAPGRIQNNIEVLRIASQSARLGVSSSFKDQRYEIAVDGRLRKRPPFQVTTTDGGEFEFGESQAADITLSVVDRRSYKGARLFASATSIFGVGDRNLNRTEAKIARVGGSKQFKDGLSEVEIDLTYMIAEDDNQGDMAQLCPAGTIDPLACYGTSSTSQIQLGGLVFHQFSPRWFGIASVRVGQQSITTADAMGARVEAPPILTTLGFLRVDYRF